MAFHELISTRKIKAAFVKRTYQAKKLKSLQTFSETGQFRHQHFLGLVRECFKLGILNRRETSFLDYLLRTYAVDWRIWSHKTRWVKGQIAEILKNAEARLDAEKKIEDEKPVPQMYLDFGKRVNFPPRGLRQPTAAHRPHSASSHRQGARGNSAFRRVAR